MRMPTAGAMRALTLLAVSLAAAPAAHGATIRGQLVNGTTNRPGTASSVRLLDMAGGMDQIATRLDVTGEFVFEDVPATSGSPYVVQVQSGPVLYSQPVSLTGDEATVEFTVYDTTESLVAVDVSVHHAIFQRHGEDVSVMEFMEFENRTDPPRAVWLDNGPIKVEIPDELHGEVECSVSAGRAPITQELLETDEDNVYTVPYALKPGTTRLVLRYTMPYHDERLEWAPTMYHPVEKRSVLVSPADIVVTGEGLTRDTSENAPAGYGVYSGPPLEAGQVFAVRLTGGSEHAVDPHAGLETSQPRGRIEIRSNPLTEKRGLIMVMLAIVLLLGLAVGLRAPTPTATVSAVEGLARLEDNYVSGKIDRATFESQRAKLLGKRTNHSHHRAKPEPSAHATPRA